MLKNNRDRLFTHDILDELLQLSQLADERLQHALPPALDLLHFDRAQLFVARCSWIDGVYNAIVDVYCFIQDALTEVLLGAIEVLFA